MANVIVFYTCKCGHQSGESMQDENYEPNVSCPKCSERMERSIKDSWSFEVADKWREAGKEVGRKLGVVQERARILELLKQELLVRREAAGGKPVSLTFGFDELLELVQRG